MASICNICCFNMNPEEFVKCPICPFEACGECHQKYIMSKVSEPKCMGCGGKWSREYVMEVFDRRWVRNDFLPHMARFLLEQEKMLLPETQGEANKAREIKRIQALVKELPCNKKLSAVYKDPVVLKYKIFERNKEKQELQDNITRIRGVRDLKITAHSKPIYIMKCKEEMCRGYVSKDYRCETCNTKYCERCRCCIGEDQHTCSKEEIENVSEIIRSTRPCPKCYVPIFKAGGCYQIWCPQCHVAFDYNTGKIEDGPIHNPMFYEYLASRPVDLSPIVMDNLACGETPTEEHFLARASLVYDVDIRMIMEIFRYRGHIQQVVLPDCSQDRVKDNLDLRVKYLNSEITEEQWMSTLLYRQKRKMKLVALEQLFNTMIVVINDILRKIYVEFTHKNIRKYCKEFQQLAVFQDETLAKICRIHGGDIPTSVSCYLRYF